MSNRRRAYPQPAYDPAANAAVGAIPNAVPNAMPIGGAGIPNSASPYDQLNNGMQNLGLNTPNTQFQGQPQQQFQGQPQQQFQGQPQQQFQGQPQQFQQFQQPNMQPAYPESPYGGPANGMPQQQQQHQQQNQQQQQPSYGGQLPSKQTSIPMNQLYSTDLLKDLPPPIVDLKFPPPPINLPLNCSVTASEEANASPDFIRSTLNVVPNSNSLLKKTKLPFSVVIRPYTSLTDDEGPIPTMGDLQIARCRRCRSYVNPFVTIVYERMKWKCNFCSLLNDFHKGWLSSSIMDRTELNYGVTEFIASPDYMVRPPQPLSLVFLLDVTQNSIQNGLLATSIRVILDSLDKIPNDQGRTNVTFICVDSKLSFFTIPHDREVNTEISMLMVSYPEGEDSKDNILLPSPVDLLVNLKACRNNIEKLLNNLPSYFSNNNNLTEFDLSLALKTGYSLLKKLGGKMVVVSSTLPNIGEGKLTTRDEASVSGKLKESTTLLTSNNSFYKSFAIDCTQSQIGVDMFLFSSTYQDVATLSNLAKYTAGQVHYYPAWNASNLQDITKFSNEFSNYLSMEVAAEAVMRIRCSDGIKGSNFYGNFFSRSSDLLSFPSLSRDQSYVIELSLDNDIKRDVVYLQSAILHTSIHGDRRIKVFTLALPVSSNINDIFASADQLSITNVLAQKAIEKVLTNSLESAREFLKKSVQDILITYKKEIVAGNVGSSSPLQISTNLRMLPLLIQSLVKNIAFRSGSVPSDHRSNALNKISSLPLPELIEYIYPSIFSLHDMGDDCGLPFEGEDNYDEIIPRIHGEIVLPENINASFNYLQKYGLYLIQTNNEMFLYIGGDAVEQLIFDIFGVNTIYEIPIGKNELPILDNEFNIRVRNIINKIREGPGSIRYESLYIVIGPSSNERGNDTFVNNRDVMALRIWCMSHLVEDKTGDIGGYRDFLGQLKDKINN